MGSVPVQAEFAKTAWIDRIGSGGMVNAVPQGNPVQIRNGRAAVSGNEPRRSHCPLRPWRRDGKAG